LSSSYENNMTNFGYNFLRSVVVSSRTMQNLSLKFNFFVEKQINQTSIGAILHQRELFGRVDWAMILFEGSNGYSELLRGVKWTFIYLLYAIYYIIIVCVGQLYMDTYLCIGKYICYVLDTLYIVHLYIIIINVY
jgi:hypothetical protein